MDGSYYNNESNNFQYGQPIRHSDRPLQSVNYAESSSEMSSDSSTSFSDTSSSYESDDSDYEYGFSKKSRIRSKQSQNKQFQQDNVQKVDTGARTTKRKRRHDFDSDDYSSEITTESEFDSGDSSGIAYRFHDTRSRNGQNYAESDSSTNESEEDENEQEKNEPKGPIIEKVIGTEIEPSEEPKYYVKFKGESYGQCRWLTKNQIDSFNGDRFLKSFYKTLRKGVEMVKFHNIPNLQILQSENIEVSKVIGYNEETDQYLVIWQKESDHMNQKSENNYEVVTWEYRDFIDNDQSIAEYRQREEKLTEIMRQIPPNRTEVQRPENYREYVSKPEEMSEYEFSMTLKPYQIPLPEFKDGRELRSYQVDGLNWLRKCWYEHRSSILADEMGLGKTAQSVCMINDLFQIGFRGPYLIVAPLSTLKQWEREFHNWTNLNVVLFSGGPEQRKIITDYELYYHDNRDVCKFEVMLLNFEKLLKEDVFNLVNSFTWEYFIVDEAHRLKDHNKKIYGVLQELKVRHKLLLTGTPIQNKLSEFWSLLHFIEPEQFNDLDKFNEEYEDKVELLKNNVINKYMLRREKNQVEKSIGEKEEHIVDIELTQTQKNLYEYLIAMGIASTQRDNYKMINFQNHGNNYIMQLRKICNHPKLFDEKNSWMKFIDPIDKCENENELIINTSGKLIFLDKLFMKLKQENAKILIFSQFVQMLGILETFCLCRNYLFQRIDGSITGNERQRRIDSFNSDPNVFIFLLCTKAGGTGLNLTAGNTVILYDSDWNPQNDAQAQARCHRIGQKNKVEVYRLVCRDTYEDDMVRKILQKQLNQENMFNENKSNSRNQQDNDNDTLQKGIKFIKKEKLENNLQFKQFKEETIEEILTKRTHKPEVIINETNDNLLENKIVLDEFLNDYINNHPNLIDTPTEQKRNRTKSLYYDDDDLDDFEEKDLKHFDFYTILKGLEIYGWGRWKEISERCKFDFGEDKLIDVCCVILQIISEEIQDNLLKLFTGYEELTNEQNDLKRFVKKKRKSDLLIEIDKRSRTLKKRFLDLKYFNEWYEKNSQNFPKSIPKLDDDDDDDWNVDDDQRLINGVYQFGWNQFGPILENVFNDKQNVEKKFLKKRFNQLFKRINPKSYRRTHKKSKKHKHTKRIVEKKEDETPKEIQISPRLLSITKTIKYFGIPKSEEHCNLFAEFANVNDPMEDLKNIIISAEELLSSQDFNPTVVFYEKPEFSFMTYSIANSIINAKKWFDRFNEFFENEFEKVDFKSLQSQTDWWNHYEMDPILFQHIYKFGFSKPCTLVIQQPFLHLIPEEEIEQYQIGSEKEINENIKGKINNVNPRLAIFFSKKQLMAQIDSIISYIIESKIPSPKIQLKSKYFQDIILPFTIKDTIIEALGTGEFFSIFGYLCQIGFRSRIKYENKTYYCRVIDNILFPFEVQMHGEQLKGRGDTPKMAIEKAIGGELPPEINPFELFGIGCPPIRFWLQKNLGIKKVTGYKSIEFEEIKKEPKENDDEFDAPIPRMRGRKRRFFPSVL